MSPADNHLRGDWTVLLKMKLSMDVFVLFLMLNYLTDDAVHSCDIVSQKLLFYSRAITEPKSFKLKNQ